jgi:hypothetical protein
MSHKTQVSDNTWIQISNGKNISSDQTMNCQKCKKNNNTNGFHKCDSNNSEIFTKKLPHRDDPSLYEKFPDGKYSHFFKRNYSPEERIMHKKALNEGRKIALNELKADKELILEKLTKLKYTINPRTQIPYNGYFDSFENLRKMVSPTEDLADSLDNDIMTIDGFNISREHFYSNEFFQTDLVDYYWNLLRNDKYYHPVRICYNNKHKPCIKIGYRLKINPNIIPATDSQSSNKNKNTKQISSNSINNLPPFPPPGLT